MCSNEKLKKFLKALAIIFIIVLIMYGYNLDKNKTNVIPYTKLTDKEQIEELKEENNRYQDEISNLESQLDELQREYKEAEDLIDILREQLEDYGIEPYEL